jgi:hypothetical protein
MLAVLFYAAMVATLAAILLDVLPVIAPRPIATRIAHNSEGFLLALVLAAWIQYARPRLTGTRREWPVTLLVATALAAVGVLLLATHLPSRFRTLNEAFLAAGLLLPYLQLRRPLPRHVAALVSAGALAVIVLGERTQAVTDLAEMLAVLVLAPIALDLVDPAILDPAAHAASGRRYAWYALLVLAPLTFSVLEYHVGVTGAFGDVIRYAVRVTEAFLCLLLLELYAAGYRSIPERTRTRSYV